MEEMIRFGIAGRGGSPGTVRPTLVRGIGEFQKVKYQGGPAGITMGFGRNPGCPRD